MVLIDGRILKGGSAKGYPIVHLSRGGVSWYGTVHRLVAQAFLENPEGKAEVNHIDGDKANNRVQNLEWATSSENRQHAYDTGLQAGPKGETNGSSKLTESDVLYIRSNPDGLTQRELADKLGVSRNVISTVIRGLAWKHVQ